MPTHDLPGRLLEAHVRFALAELTSDDRRDDLVAAFVDDLLRLGEQVTLDEALDHAEVVRVVRRILTTVPPSAAATRLSQGAADVLHGGPDRPFTAAEVIGRDDMSRAIDELVRSEPLVKRALDEIVESSLVAGLASRFVTRLVGDGVAANRAAAERLPGIGGLVSLGAGAASKAAQIAARRLNKVATDTLKDPGLKAALLEVWDARSSEPISGLPASADRDDVRRIIALVHDVMVGALGSEPIGDLAERLVDMVFETYGGTPATTVVAELGIGRDDLVLDAQHAAGQALSAMAADGRLEALIRRRLEPFYRSEELRSVLEGA